ncbi:phenylalanine--tRNA ligase subunit beta [Candidatus Woesearchaeota archaeon]|nr:phenylalanine--tRNA ligase subunit beta [Candidatus Woesearchaeota archaeon]
MVIIDTTFSTIQNLTTNDLTINELEEILANMGMELDDVSGDNIKIEITAERTDLITPEGLARAIKSYKGINDGFTPIKIENSDYEHVIDPKVKSVRAQTLSFVVKNVKLTDEKIKALMWLQEKIHDTYGRKRKKVSIGLYDLDKISFPVKYTTKRPEEISFVPLGENKKMNALEILEHHPTGKTYAHLLDNMKEFPIQIDSQDKILSLPPIINSNDLGKVNPTTKNLFVESTGPSKKYLDSIMNVLASMFYDWGAKIFLVNIKDDINYVCPDLKLTNMEVSLEFANKWIGPKFKSEEAKIYLQKMGHNVKEIKDDKIDVEISPTRTDIWHQVDLADDIARGFGYNNIKPKIPNVASTASMLPLNKFNEDLCNFLVGLGYNEVKTFALTNHKSQYELMQIEEQKHIKLGKNTADKELSMVRSWLMPEVLKALVANRNRSFPQRIFELGTVIIPDNNADVKARNVEKLVCILSDDKVDFTSMKQTIEAIGQFVGVNFSVKEFNHPSFILGRSGKVIMDNEEIGIIGELHPQVLTNWDVLTPTTALEINIEKIFRKIKN